MKLQIVNKNQEHIEGFTVITTKGSEIDLSSVVDNQCELIFAPDVMDTFPVSSLQELVKGLISKLRLGGEIVLGGTDIRLFCKAVSNAQVPYGDASQMIGACSSMTTPDMTADLLKAFQLSVQNIHINGLHYEVKAKRG